MTPKAVLFVQPYIFAAIAVENAVDHDVRTLDVRLPTGTGAVVKNDRSGDILGQLAFDRPHQLLAPLLIGLGRLLLDQFADFWVTVAVPIQVRTAAIKELEDLIGVGATGLEVETDGEILAEDFGEIGSGVDGFEFAVDVDRLQLIDQYHRRITEDREVARRHRDLQLPVGAVAELLHDLSTLCTVLLHIGPIAGKLLHHIWRQTHHPPTCALQSPPVTDFP